MGNRGQDVGGGEGGSVGGGGEEDVGCLAWAAGVGEDGWGEAGVGGRARGGRGSGVGDACGRGGIGTVGVCRV
jgi:hypothetical protein